MLATTINRFTPKLNISLLKKLFDYNFPLQRAIVKGIIFILQNIIFFYLFIYFFGGGGGERHFGASILFRFLLD